MKEWIVVAVVVIVNIPLYIVIGKIFFSDGHTFMEALKFTLTPNIISAFKGEYWEDKIASFKLGFMCAICIIVVGGELYLLDKYEFVDLVKLKEYLPITTTERGNVQ